MNIQQVELAGVRVFYEDMEGTIYECFKDKPKKQVDTLWFNQQLMMNRKNGFSAFKFAEEQMGHYKKHMYESRLRDDETVEFYYRYGILSEVDYTKYKERYEIE